MNNLVHPFPCPIYQNFIDDKSFIHIKDNVYNYTLNNKSKFLNKWFCPTLASDVKNKSQFSVLIKELEIHAEKYTSLWNFNQSLKPYITDLWINVARPGDYQEGHIHLDAMFAGVMYIEVNDLSGNFQFINPLKVASLMMGHPKLFDYNYNIHPQNNLLLMFPSWMEHRALQNTSNKDRISLSFNINLK
tara:strand:- start:258 stop:824 length:567 start_codon:yes stop_codon:yes gene_type:complete